MQKKQQLLQFEFNNVFRCVTYLQGLCEDETLNGLEGVVHAGKKIDPHDRVCVKT